MAPHRLSRGASALLCLLVVAPLLTGCGKKASSKAVVRGVLGFDQNVEALANQPLFQPDPGVVCGSPTEEFGVELVHVSSPAQAKVLNEWGEIVPGKQMFVSGTVAQSEFSQGDLSFTHPFDKDIVADIRPDGPFAQLAQRLGSGSDEDGPPPGTLHWELSRDLFPHNEQGFYLLGYLPGRGDRIASYGRWIVDCGHDDFHTELHPPTFLAVAHPEGARTVAHAFFNPYYETQLFTPDATLPADLTNDRRLADPNTRPFPLYLYHQLLSLAHVGEAPPGGFIDHLEAHHLLEANRASPITWYVCAPQPKPQSASGLQVSYHFTVRSGVTVKATTDEDTGCVRFTGTLGPGYRPLNPERHDCVDPWSELNQQAGAALGQPGLDIEKVIEEKVPPAFAPAVKRDPSVDCYDALAVPLPGGPDQGARIFTSDDQPYPFYGEATVLWETSPGAK
jgi:hypothetical protein